MRPVLFEVDGIPIYAYGTFFLLSLLTVLGLVMYEARRRHWPKEEVFPIVVAAFVGGMIGARLSILVFNGWQTAPEVLNFVALFDPRIGPGSILGGIGGAYLGGYFASRVMGKDGCSCDAFAPAMALGNAIGRVGIFLAGVDGLGKPTTLPWGVQLPGNNYLVHPAPLYDAGFDIAWFALLMALRDHPAMQNGNLLKFGIAGYAVVRFFIEFVRNNRVMLLGLTGQQLFCVALLVGIGAWFALHQRRLATA
ncbi:MAG TPA: prolipoprotein diacylglyceryl transferase family protein [Candidatus Dormibacteraeota bacterium]|nr:prolipoprotein diacylglyceryl transferase family protein [Candidatus Dormibacteraeota bacterium]